MNTHQWIRYYESNAGTYREPDWSSPAAIHDPATNTFADVGLPFGPKPRLILLHLNTEAVRRQSAEVDVQRSMTAFATRVLLIFELINGPPYNSSLAC